MLAFFGIPDFLPYFNIINHDTFFGIALVVGAQRLWKKVK